MKCADRRALLAGLMAFLILLCATAPASGQAVPAAACQPQSAAPRLGTTLPLELLNHLERISGSVFVHAFLTAHIAETGTPDHWLTQCARSFVDAPASDLATLRAQRVGAGAMLRALRAAEQARLEDEQIRAAAQLTVASIVPELRRDLGPSSVDAYAPYFERALETGCVPGPAPVCNPLRATVTQIGVLQEAQQALDIAAARADRLSEEEQRAAAALRVLNDAIITDSLHLAVLTDTLSAAADGEVAPDSAQLRQLHQQLRSQRAARDSLAGERAGLAGQRSDALAEQQRQDATVVRARQVLRQRLDELSGALQAAAATPLVSERIDLPPRDAVRTRLTLTDHAPLAAVEVRPQGGRSLNLIAELTDFVIDRARQELVLTHLAGLYGTMRRDALLQGAFPETFRLMRGLAADDPARGLSAMAAGRIPLNVWRATLATDYTRLPVNLLLASPTLLCGSSAACELRVAQLRPVALASQRLMAGDPVFDILRELPLAARTGSVASAEADLLTPGLSLVAAIAEAYQLQGLGLSADPVRHPYVLSPASLSQASRAQQAAFVRLLLVRAAPPALDAMDVDAGGLLEVVRRATSAVDAIAATQLVAAAQLQPLQLVRASLTAVSTAADAAAVLAPDAAASRGLTAVRQQWQDFAAAVEPLVAGDYHLALSRTTVLLRGVTGEPLSRNMLTLAALGSGLAGARTGADVRMAFEAASSPPGGWQAKRYREGARASVTAYPGLAGGLEWLLEGDAAPTVGVALPIGPEVQLLRRRNGSGDVPRCVLGVCSIGVFVPVMDAGALLSYRLENAGEVSSTPNTSLRQLFAPGAYLSLGIGRSAFSILAGGQFMPGIRKVTAAESTLSGHAVRVGAAVVLDVMLFEFR